jgi:hypothetical protein
MPTPVYNVYKAKDRVVDRNGTVWQYNALYGTFRAHYDATGKALATYGEVITYSADALEKQLGPLKPYEEPKPINNDQRFEVIARNTPPWNFVNANRMSQWLSHLTLGNVDVKELSRERRKGVADRRVFGSWQFGYLTPARRNAFTHGRRKDDKAWWW